MARNRLGEYRELEQAEPPAETIIPLTYDAPSQVIGLDAFLRTADEIRGMADRIESHLENIKNFNKRMLGEAVPSAEEYLKNQIDSSFAECKRLLQDGRERLQLLKSSRGGDPTERQRVFTDVGRRLRSATQSYLLVETDVAATTRQQFTRQIKIVRPDASDEEVNAMIDSGDMQRIFSTAQLQENVGSQRRMFDEVAERKKKLDMILMAMNELSAIVSQLNDMISTQQVFLDDIEKSVEATHVNAVYGSELLTKANDSAVAARRKQWYIFAIIGVVVTILIIIIAIVVASNSNKNKK
ncbi:t-SNARE [Chytridium lagenaria]|nr:t-SNARE [Chytridium lagenaria]